MQEDDIINFVRSLSVDPLLTENVKSKIIAKVRLRDSGIMGAYQLYLVDGDADLFKARITHRALTPPVTNNVNISIRNWHTYELHTYLWQALRYYEFKHKFAADELVLG